MSEARIGTAAADYETLRGGVLDTRPAADLGLAVLLRHGMLVWLRAGRPAPRIGTPAVARMAADLRDDLVYAMVSTAIASGGVARRDVAT